MKKTFNTIEEMERYMVEGKYEISCVIVDKIIENYPTKKPIHIMEWCCNEDNTDYSVECHPKDIKSTLLQNMEMLIEVEDYKRCHEAKKIIDQEPWVDEDEDDGYSADDGGEEYIDSDYDY